MRNNINISGLSEFADEVKGEKTQGDINYQVDVNWLSGTKNSVTVNNIKLGDQKLVREFNFEIDEPNQLLGLNTNPTPQEYLMAGVAGCMSVTFVAGATLMGVTLETLCVKVSGEINLHGFLGFNENEPTGFNELNFEIIVSGDGTIKQYELLKNRVMKHSPNFASISNGVKMNTKITIFKGN